VTAADSWFVEWDPPKTARALLVCLPHAGSGAHQFRTWQELIGPEVAVLAVQLPGRENRWRQPPVTDAEEVVGQLAPSLSARLDLPYVVFGHSMGALLGYELARTLGSRHGQWPARFVASACRAPHRQGEDAPSAELSDEQLVAELIRHGALPEYVARDERLVRLVVRPLRGDLAICDTYVHTAGEPLPCPLSAWRGRDDMGVTHQHIQEWSGYSTAGTTVRTFQGGHQYHMANAQHVVDGLRRLMTRTDGEK
jgi:medium-chain acyl-[acyl-carrier-protein] hydrolase